MRGLWATLVALAGLGCTDRPLTVDVGQTLYQGEVAIDAGRYRVAVDAAKEQIELTGDTATHRVSAIVRGRVFAVRKANTELRKVRNEPRWLLLVRLPPDREWVAALWESPQR